MIEHRVRTQFLTTEENNNRANYKSNQKLQMILVEVSGIRTSLFKLSKSLRLLDSLLGKEPLHHPRKGVSFLEVWQVETRASADMKHKAVT